ncbi:MAG: ARMT1-like domain-containing protein [Methanomassiliicoccales archaeon]|nr:ARMT1-like domain-containing protein [Methanomassiliicoccales archaeon]
MRFSAECVPCLLNRVLYEVRLVAPDKAEKAMEASLEILDEKYPEGMNSAALATEVHRIVYGIAGSRDPYERLKVQSDEVAQGVFPKAESFVNQSENKLEAAALCAVAGNVVDFGIDASVETPDQLARQFQIIVAEGFAVDDLERARKRIVKAKKVLYLLDNCGESVLDRLLVREIRAMGPKVIGVVKGEPILTDVTMEDALRVGLDKEFDELLSTDQFAVGMDPAKASARLRRELDSSDLIVAKGMANFEALGDRKLAPTLYLMRAKCNPVADAIGAKRNDNVARLID